MWETIIPIAFTLICAISLPLCLMKKPNEVMDWPKDICPKLKLGDEVIVGPKEPEGFFFEHWVGIKRYAKRDKKYKVKNVGDLTEGSYTVVATGKDYDNGIQLIKDS